MDTARQRRLRKSTSIQGSQLEDSTRAPPLQMLSSISGSTKNIRFSAGWEEMELPSSTSSRFAETPADYFPRPSQEIVLHNLLAGNPSFFTLFGAPSHTYLLKRVLEGDVYHVLHLDFKLPGFFGLKGLCERLCHETCVFWKALANLEGYSPLAHIPARFSEELRRIRKQSMSSEDDERWLSCLARLIKMLQESLHFYQSFIPASYSPPPMRVIRHQRSITWYSLRKRWTKERVLGKVSEESGSEESFPQEVVKPVKRRLVIVLNHADLLAATCKSTEAMKSLLESFWLLSGQEKLCHVVCTASDPNFRAPLEATDGQILTIPDCSREQMRLHFVYLLDTSIPSVFHQSLHFGVLFDAFGGRIAHWKGLLPDFMIFVARESPEFRRVYSRLNDYMLKLSAAAERPRSARGLHLSGHSAREDSDFLLATLTILDRVLHEQTIPYYSLSREFGLKCVTGLIQAGVIYVHWTSPIIEVEPLESGNPGRVLSNESGMIPLTPTELKELRRNGSISQRKGAGRPNDVPCIVPASSIALLAVRELLQEYDDEGSISEYASLPGDTSEY
ncbi:hypothetical protein DL96DRAFT_1708279 [Flagelloscypha sp. PMI_526]|nr:hypothetical protein DL96DRAFT_1708279 [Flagelloscypha sp. PMI_526]